MTQPQNESATFHAKWRTVAVSSLLVSAGSLAVLVASVGLENIDVLSSVALLVAIVTFGAQLVAFAAQTQSANQQRVEAEQLNAETRTLLAEVRTNTEAVLRTLGDQFDRLLRHVVGDVEQAAAVMEQDETVSSPSNPPIPPRSGGYKWLLDYFDTAVRQQRQAMGQTAQPPPEVGRLLSHLNSYPDEEEGKPLIEPLSRLSPFAITQIERRAEREKAQLAQGDPRGTFIQDVAPVSEELINAGFVEFAPAPEGAAKTRFGSLG